MGKKNRNIRELESKAKKGGLLPAFQLFQNYTYGQGDVEVDEYLANQYFEQCANYLSSGTVNENGVYKLENLFTLDSLELFDFRRFKHLQINFESDLTVLIGGNGEGKTTIAHAIAKTLSWITASIIKEDGAGQRLSASFDIRNDSENMFADVISNFSYGKGVKRISASLSRAAVGVANKRDSKVRELKSIANVWRIVNDKYTVNLPLYAFYSIERSHPLDKTNKEGSSLRENRFDAYKDALVGAGKFEHFVVWFIALHKKTANDQSGNIENLIQEVDGLTKSVDNGIISLKPLLEDAKRKLKEAQLKQRLAKEQQTLTDLQRKTLVVKAICDVIPSVSDIWVETESGVDIIMLKNDDITIKLSQLSDGQRIFLALVSDLTRRLVLLNPKLDSPLCGQGVVLIDEIELHLHPKWQQNIVLDLQKTFPNIQFIVTTHSPQILSTVDKRCIRLFVVNEHGNICVKTPEFQTRGVQSADILAHIMETNSIPDVEEAREVNIFSSLLLSNKKEEATKVLNTLVDHFGEDHPVILDCRNQIKIYEMKERVRQRREAKNSK